MKDIAYSLVSAADAVGSPLRFDLHGRTDGMTMAQAKAHAQGYRAVHGHLPLHVARRLAEMQVESPHEVALEELANV